ncbi:ATP-dependent RNA helicase vasa [Pseudomyrmex gracilis]|uniref:ATP-dependent RNA helicase vasa n=1 Tax=Pseudomyrmex gracilis TaxID=219809 RepID=UPI00099500D1|nr:ATP-dependent RNA helicase vasa [Pseudomyrmex gracilis]
MDEWNEDPVPQTSLDTSMFDQGHDPRRGRGRGSIPHNNNNDIKFPIGGDNTIKNNADDEWKEDGWNEDSGWKEESQDNFSTQQDDTNNYNTNNDRGNRRGRDRSHYNGRNNGDDRWKGNRNNGQNNWGNNDGDTEKDGNDRRDNRFRRDRDNDRGDQEGRGGRGGGRGGRRGGGRGGGRNGDNDRGFNRNDSDNEGRGRKNNDDDNQDGEKKREIYIPPDEPTDENNLFAHDVSMGINFAKYDDIEVKVTGENAPQPINSFEDSHLRTLLLENIRKSSYTKPTPVQKYAIPIIIKGRDLMACAQTGSGKTAAFVLPILHTLLEDYRDLVQTESSCEPQAIIISPTRELTIQIFQQVRKFSLGSILRSEIAYGGTSTMHQANRVRNGCHVLVATPGRLLDFIGRGRIKLSSLRFLVLDEADRMLDMGFLPDVEKIVDHDTISPTEERQMLMFSATFPYEIQELAGRFLRNYLFLTVGIVGGACSDVEQNFMQSNGASEKRKHLKNLLQDQQEQGQVEGTLVFVEQKKHVDFIAAFLSENNFPATSIHGDRLQREREEALNDFKNGKMWILVATAVAARGLDIKNVTHVINYDLPKTIEEYVHRIGRTGRVGNRGKATALFDPNVDGHLTEDLVRILKQANQPVPDWLESCSGGGGGGGGASRGFASGRGRRFGGEDIRGDNNAYEDVGYVPPVQAEPEEVW